MIFGYRWTLYVRVCRINDPVHTCNEYLVLFTKSGSTLLRHGTTTRQCMAGHLSSLARASTTGDGEIFSAKMRGAELWGTRAIPLDSLVEIKWLYFGLASVALGNGAAAQFDGQGRVIRKGINRGGNSVMLHKVSMTNSVAIRLYPAKILGWIRKGDKVTLVTVHSRIDGVWARQGSTMTPQLRESRSTCSRSTQHSGWR
jgi:hypothetical protein